MFGLGLKEFRRHIFTNLFIALQLAAVFFIVISIVSSIHSRTSLYSPVKELLGMDGAYALKANYSSEDGQPLEDIVPEIDRYIGISRLAIADNSGDKAVCYCYDNEALLLYDPPLAEGRWLDADTAELECVVNYDSEYSVGDVITKEYQYYRDDDVTFTDPETKEIRFKIVGRLAKDAPVFGLNSRTSKKDDHRSLFDSYTSKAMTMLLCPQSAAEGHGIGSYRTNHQLVIFKEGLSDEEITKAVKEINALTGFAIPLSELRANSERFVYEQLIRLAPILISIVILILVSTVAISALNAKMNMHTSAVYALLGCTMKGCSIIYLVSSLVTSIMAATLCGVLLNTLRIIGKLEETVIAFDGNTLLWCLVVWTLFLICSMTAPMIALGRATVKEQLVANE